MTKRILIVDDEQPIRRIVQISLERFAGWQAILAASGREGLAIAQTEPIDLILLDVSMPDIDGFQFFDQLKANPMTRNVAVILLTAKSSASDQRRFSEMGVTGVIPKPFQPTAISHRIVELLGWE